MTRTHTYQNRIVLTLVNITVLFLFLSIAVGTNYAQQHGVIPNGGGPRVKPPNAYIGNNFPYRTVAKLFVTFPSGDTTQGTGVFIGADRVFTAAHVVYQKQYGGTASKVEIIPGYNGESNPPFGRTDAKRILVPTEYMQNKDRNYDFAAIVTVDGLGHKSGWLGYYVPRSPNLGNIQIIGYPIDIDNAQAMAYSGSNATLANGNEISYKADTNSGMSGAPIIQRVNNTWLVIGVHTRGGDGLPFNFGVRFSDYFLSGL